MLGSYTMVKITKEEFDRTVPHYCNCPDKEIIEWKDSFKNTGIPKYKVGHRKKVCRVSERKKYKCEYNRLRNKRCASSINANKRKWKKEHPEKVKNYHQKNKEKDNKRVIEWAKKNPERIRENNRKFSKTPKGKECNKRKKQKHYRELGWVLINKKFSGSEGHHVDRNNVIFIPIELHESIWHNVYTGKNMVAINTITFFFLMMQNIDELNKLFTKI